MPKKIDGLKRGQYVLGWAPEASASMRAVYGLENQPDHVARGGGMVYQSAMTRKEADALKAAIRNPDVILYRLQPVRQKGD